MPPVVKQSVDLLLLCIFLLAAGVASINSVQAAQVLKIATISPDGTMWMKKMRAGGKEIEERTEGRVKIKFYPGGVMGNDQSMFRKMRFGQLHGGMFPIGALADVYQDIHIYAMPSLFTSLDEVAYVRAQMDQELLDGLAENGLIGFGFLGGGFTYSMSARPQRSVEDLRRHKVWIPEDDVISKELLTSAQVTPIPLPLADVLTGLQTGMINSVAATPVGAIAFQWYTKLPYLTDLPINYFYGMLAIDKKAFNKLKKEDRKVVREVFTRVNTEIEALNRADHDQALETLVKQGVTIVKMTPEKEQEWIEIAHSANRKLGEKKAFTPEVYSRLQALIAEYRQVNN